MRHSEIFAILILVTLTVVNTASCQNRKTTSQENVVDSTIENINAFRETFWKNLPTPKGYVNDYENLYTDTEEKTLDSLIGSFAKKTTIQIALITIDTLMTSKDSLDAFTLLVGNAWGIGQKEKKNGIVIGISRGYTKMRIQNGYGIETLITDAETKAIVDTAFIPHFRIGEYYEGTTNGLKTLMATLTEKSK